MSKLARISPFGPVFNLELRVASRRKRTYLLRVGYLAVLLLTLLAAYADNRSGGGLAAETERLQSLGQSFFSAYAICLMLAVSMVAPVLTSNAISGERLARTLPVLLMTPITAWQIVGGKLFSRLLSTLTLVALGLPVLAMVRLLGGVELGDMVAVVVLAVSFALGCASLGLFLSAKINRPAYVVLAAYAILVAVYVVVPFCVALIAIGSRSDPGSGTILFAAAVNPWMGLATIFGRDARFIPQYAWVGSVIGQLVLAAFFTARTAAVLRRQASQSAQESTGSFATNTAALTAVSIAPPSVATAPAVSPVPPTVPSPWDAGPARSARADRPSTAVSDNPVLWRELRRPLFRSSVLRGVVVAATLGLMLLVCAGGGAAHVLDRPGFVLPLSLFMLVAWWMMSAVLGASSSLHEKESDTWTLLLATPLTGRQVVYAKFAGVCRRMLGPTLLMSAYLGFFSLILTVPVWSVLVIVFLITSTGLLWLAISVGVSVWARRMPTAIICGLLPAVALYGALPLAMGIIGEIVTRDDDVAQLALWVNPYAHLTSLLEGLDRLRRISGYGSGYYSAYITAEPYRIGDVRMSAGPFVLAGLACGIAHLLAAWGAMEWAAGAFNRLAGRSGQFRLAGVAPSSDALPGDAQTKDSASREVDMGVPSPLSRIAAFIVDAMLLQIGAATLSLVIAAAWAVTTDEDMNGAESAEVGQVALMAGMAVAASVGWVVCGISESLAWRSTPGKWLFGLRVVGADGNRLSVGHALLRNLVKAATIWPLGGGAWLALGDRTGRALHDRAVAARVIQH
jgi:ABC-type transport system involved in multi-copper enzyme maturation permease subunit/uncharacterized RDD family membrane protein YckC